MVFRHKYVLFQIKSSRTAHEPNHLYTYLIYSYQVLREDEKMLEYMNAINLIIRNW